MKERIKSLDGLKGLACCLIAFICHYLDFFSTNYLHYTGRMVELFIGISGFGMAYAFKDKIKNMSFNEYFGKRYFKIMPLYWMTGILCFIVQSYAQFHLGHTIINQYKLDLFHTFLGIIGIECGWFTFQNPVNGPAWAINVILLCYIIYYIICRISKSPNMYFGILFLLLFVSLSCIIREVKIPFFHYDNSCRAYASFIVGALLFEFYNKASTKGGIIIVSSGVFLFLFFSIIMINLLHQNINFILGNVKIITIIFFVPLILLMSLYCKAFKYILETRIMQFLGKISIGIYLWHRFFKICIILFTDINKSWLGYFIYISLVLICSIWSHLVLEPKLYHWVSKLKSVILNNTQSIDVNKGKHLQNQQDGN